MFCSRKTTMLAVSSAWVTGGMVGLARAAKYSVRKGTDGMDAESERFGALLAAMTRAVCAGDGKAAAACFTPAGVYHDGFYGEFAGREAIARMIRDFFHRDASDFEWQVFDVCSDGRVGYARYRFSYVSKIAGSAGRRIGFSGISFCVLQGGRIKRYGEIFERAPVLAQLGFADERILKAMKHWAG